MMMVQNIEFRPPGGKNEAAGKPDQQTVDNDPQLMS